MLLPSNLRSKTVEVGKVADCVCVLLWVTDCLYPTLGVDSWTLILSKDGFWGSRDGSAIKSMY